MYRTSALVLALAAAVQVAAQSSTVTKVLMPLQADSDIFGSVVKVENSLTTIALACPQSEAGQASSDPCGDIYKATVIIGSTTVQALQTYSDIDATSSVVEEVTLGCVLGTKDATCIATLHSYGSLQGQGISTSVSTESVTSTVIADWTESATPLTITGGLEKLAPAKATGTEAGASSSSKAGAPMMTAQAVLGGVAGVAAVIAAL